MCGGRSDLVADEVGYVDTRIHPGVDEIPEGRDLVCSSSTCAPGPSTPIGEDVENVNVVMSSAATK
jgi:hypothetical protein